MELPTLPLASVAVAVTVVVPIGKTDPAGGTFVVAQGPEMASLAEVEKVTTAPFDPVAKTVILAGTVTTGGVPSGIAETSEEVALSANPLRAVTW